MFLGSCCPIALSNCDLKIFERLVNFRLMWYLEKENLLNNNQIGFRRGRSTTNSLTTFSGDILESFEKRSHTTAVFFDMQGAYDRTWAEVIINQLVEWGFHGHILDFIKFYLTSRKIRVRIGSTLSSEESIDNGVPQGGVLSVTLFLVAINGIFKFFNPDDPNKILVYADDIVVYNDSLDDSERCIQLQKCVNEIGKWASRNGFRFSPSKTKIMHFCRKHRCRQIPLSLNGSLLEYVETYKYLGLWFDPKLSFKKHIRETKTACNTRLNVIKCLSGLTWGSHRNSLLTIHENMILPKMFYGSEVFACCASKTLLSTLNSVYNAGYRLSTGAFRTSPVDSLLVEAGVAPLSARLEYVRLNSAIRMLSNSSVPGHQELLSHSTSRSQRNFFGIVGPTIDEVFQDLSIERDFRESYPPWVLQPQNINLRFTTCAYKDMDVDELNELFNSVCRSISPHHKVLFTDGSAHDDKRGFAVTTESESVLSVRCHESLSVYTLESLAIKSALKFVENLNPLNQASFHYIIATDSLSVLRGVLNLGNFNPTIKEIRDILIKFSNRVTLIWVPGHRGILGNEKADHDAKLSSNLSLISHRSIPLSSALSIYKNYHTNKIQKWYSREVSGFIKKVVPLVSRPLIPNSLSRKDSTILTRLRIGHSRLTQSYKFSRSSTTPLCPACKKILSIEHILCECKNLSKQRETSFQHNNPLKMLDFSEVNNNKILKYLHSLELIEEI
ncbi:hypothetical protein DMENIID0001_006810 [Sergentomyia squamirostris]